MFGYCNQLLSITLNNRFDREVSTKTMIYDEIGFSSRYYKTRAGSAPRTYKGKTFTPCTYSVSRSMSPNDRRLVEAIGFTIDERSLVIDEETPNPKTCKGTNRKIRDESARC